MYVLAIATGLRQGELLGLKWEDVDFETGVIRVKRTLSKSNQGLVFAPPKSTKGYRSVGLTDLGVRSLKKHLALQVEEKASWREDHDLVFPTIDGRPRKSRRYVTDALKKALEKAGVRH
jgi:integrase